jgi:hypothetical protein
VNDSHTKYNIDDNFHLGLGPIAWLGENIRTISFLLVRKNIVKLKNQLENLWLSNVLSKLGLIQIRPIELRCDN